MYAFCEGQNLKVFAQEGTKALGHSFGRKTSQNTYIREACVFTFNWNKSSTAFLGNWKVPLCHAEFAKIDEC